MPQVTDAYGKTFNIDQSELRDFQNQLAFEKSLIDGTVFEKYNFDRETQRDVQGQMTTARELGILPDPNQPPPAEEPPAEEPPADDGIPDLGPPPDRTDVFLGGDNRNTMGDASFNLAKFASDFEQKFYTKGRRTGKLNFNISRTENVTPEELALYDINKDGKIGVDDALDIKIASGEIRTEGPRLQGIYNAIHANSSLMEEAGYRSDPKTFLLDDGRTFTVDNPTLDSSYEQTGFSNAFLNENAVNSGFDQQAVFDYRDTQLNLGDQQQQPEQVEQLPESDMGQQVDPAPIADTVVDPAQEEVVTYADTTPQTAVPETTQTQTEEVFSQPVITGYDPTPTTTTPVETTPTTTDTGLTTAPPPPPTTGYTPVSATVARPVSTVGLGSVPTFGGGYQPGSTFQPPELDIGDSGVQTVTYRNERGQQMPVTLKNGQPITYIPPGYVRSMSEGGAVMPLESEHNLANKFLGYTGEKSRPAIDSFYKSNPGAAARMGEYQKAVTGMSYGGYTGGPAERGRGAPAASPAPRSQPAAGVERGRTQQPRVSTPAPQAATQRLSAPTPRDRDDKPSQSQQMQQAFAKSAPTTQTKPLQYSDTPSNRTEEQRTSSRMKEKGIEYTYTDDKGTVLGEGDSQKSILDEGNPWVDAFKVELDNKNLPYDQIGSKIIVPNNYVENSKNAKFGIYQGKFFIKGKDPIYGNKFEVGLKYDPMSNETQGSFDYSVPFDIKNLIGMNQGGMVTGYQEGGETTDPVEVTDEDVSGIGYQEDIVPMFQDVVGQTMQPIQAPVSYLSPTADQDIGSGAGQVSDVAPYASAATVGTVETAMTPGVADTATYGATTAADAVGESLEDVESATGAVSKGAQVGAAQGTVSDAAMVDAAQFDPDYIDRVNAGEMNVTSSQLVNAAGQDEVAPAVKIAQSSGIDPAIAQQATVSVNELPEAATIAESNMAQAKVAQSGGLLREEATAYAAKLDTFSVDNGTLAKAIQGEVGALGTVQGQLEGLMSQFDDGTPAWAAGAMRAANAAMAARGLGGSSMAGAAILQAAMESALPIAQQDAQTFNQMNMSNINRRQQVALTNAAAQQGLALQNLSNEQQVALQNSTNAFALQTQDLSNMQQTFLANAQIKASLQGQNLSNQQQTNLVTAARYAEVANMNLNNRQQTALVNNANNLQIELSNLSNKQQAYLSNAQLSAALQGKQIDNQQQAAIQNAARFSEAANINFNAEQQEQLHNSELMKTIGLANLTNTQAGVLQNAATIAGMDMANLNNRQQAAVQNAQSFLQMDMANLSNEQQTAMFKAQQNVQALFTDQAATNAASQFNATSENQTNQFFASLASQTSQFNATQTNAINQANVSAVNSVRQFNSNLQNQRDQFNANNGLVVAQANAQWRQNLATINTATQNESNRDFAKTMNAMTSKNIDAVWQRERDIMSLAFQTAESNADNATSIILQQMAAEAQLTAAELQSKIEATQSTGNFLSEVFLKIIDL